MITIRLDSPLPLVDQIAAALRNAIALRKLRPGDELPPVRQLAADLGVNLNTVARAYQALEAEGLAIAARGRGTQVASARKSPSLPKAELRRQLAERLRHVLADAVLAGLDRSAVEALTVALLDEYWPAAKP